MKRSGPLKRKTPLKARSVALKQSKPLAAESPKRRAERPLRAAVRAEALDKANWSCAAAGKLPVECGGGFDVDEYVLRSAKPGGHLDPDNVQVLCRNHHIYKHLNPVEAADAGLRPYPIGYMGPRKGEQP